MSTAGQWDFTVSGESILKTLNTSGGNFLPREQSFVAMSMRLVDDKIIYFYESGQYVSAIKFQEIGSIAGVTPTTLQDAYNKILALIVTVFNPANYDLEDFTNNGVNPFMQKGISLLGDLEDINIVSVANNEVLAYNQATGKWINKTISAVTSPNLEEVTTAGNETTNPLIIKDPSDPTNKYIEIKGDVINIYDLSLSILPIGMYSKDGFIIADSGTTTRGLFDVFSGYTVEDGAKAFIYGLDFQSILDKITNKAIYFQYPTSIDNDYAITWRNKGGNPAFTDEIPTSLSELSEDISHRTVTDAEKSAWNAVIGGSVFQSVWNANTNSPALSSGVGTKGYYYIVNTNGSTNLDGITDWKVGDWAIFDGSVWRKVDNTDAVSSVNSLTGAVNLDTSNVPDTSGKRYVSETEKSTWSGKQDSLSDSNFGSFSNSLTSKTTPVDSDSVNIVDSADSNKSKKLSLTNLKTFLANTFSLKSMGANTIRVNNTNATANAVEEYFKQSGMQNYTGTPVWTGTADPSGTTNLTYNFIRIGNLVTLNVTGVYGTTGTANTSVSIPFISDFPIPIKPTGLSASSNMLYTGTGCITSSLSSATSTVGRVQLKSNLANTGYEIQINMGSQNAVLFTATVHYFTN